MKKSKKKIKIILTKQYVDILKKLGSKDKKESENALRNLKKFLHPVILSVIDKAPTIYSLYCNEEKEFDDFVAKFK